MLTPIEKYNNIYFKRDDKFAPYGDVNGGKMRQTIALFEKYKDKIKNEHNNGVIQSVSVHSPTASVISRVAKEYGFNSIFAVGGTKPETLQKRHIIQLAQYYGGEIRIVAGHGINSVLAKRTKDIIEQNNYFYTSFDKWIMQEPELMLDTNGEQAKNLPDEMDTLVMSCGVGIQMSAVMYGIKKYNKKVKRIIGVGVGPDRTKNIRSYFGLESGDYDFEFYTPKTSYSTPINITIDTPMYDEKEYQPEQPSFKLDDLYEAKAYKWMLENVDTGTGTNVFWCVGRRLSPEEVCNIKGSIQ